MTIQTQDLTWKRGACAPSLVMTFGDGFDDVRVRVFSTNGPQEAIGNMLAFTATLADDTLVVTDAPSGTVSFDPTSEQTALLTPNLNGKPRNLFTVEVKAGGVWTKRIEGPIFADGGGPIPVTGDGTFHSAVEDFYEAHPDYPS